MLLPTTVLLVVCCSMSTGDMCGGELQMGIEAQFQLEDLFYQYQCASCKPWEEWCVLSFSIHLKARFKCPMSLFNFYTKCVMQARKTFCSRMVYTDLTRVLISCTTTLVTCTRNLSVKVPLLDPFVQLLKFGWRFSCDLCYAENSMALFLRYKRLIAPKLRCFYFDRLNNQEKVFCFLRFHEFQSHRIALNLELTGWQGASWTFAVWYIMLFLFHSFLKSDLTIVVLHLCVVCGTSLQIF